MVLRGADGADGDDRLRVVVVSGSTGVGKSKLAVDLAAANGGEVVNADALQLYAGLAVTTNQATAEEMAGARTERAGPCCPVGKPGARRRKAVVGGILDVYSVVSSRHVASATAGAPAHPESVACFFVSYYVYILLSTL